MQYIHHVINLRSDHCLGPHQRSSGQMKISKEYVAETDARV